MESKEGKCQQGSSYVHPAYIYIYICTGTVNFAKLFSLLTLQIVGGSEHTLRAKLTFSQESHGTCFV